MSWEQLGALADGGMALGAHGHSHAVFATLSEDRQREEMARSKSILESRIGRPVRTLAYPVGGPLNFTAATERIARETGFAAAFSFSTGHERWPIGDAYAVRRVHVPAGMPLFFAKVRIPGVFATG